MPKSINNVKLSDTLTLSECTTSGDYPGPWWLYDKTRGMNLAMGELTQQDAFVEALGYYQERLKQTEDELRDLNAKVQSFLVQFKDDEDY